jgi:hypothetical protein
MRVRSDAVVAMIANRFGIDVMGEVSSIRSIILGHIDSRGKSLLSYRRR